MQRLYGSFNSRFFAVLHPGDGPPREVAIHRENATLWKVPLEGLEEVLRLGNQGNLFYRNRDGIYHLPPCRNPVPELILTPEDVRGNHPGARLGKVQVDAEGRSLFFERIYPEERFSRRLFQLLGAGSRGTPEVHQLVLHDIATGESSEFHRGAVDPGGASRFVWAVSPTGSHLAVGQPERRGGLHVKVIDVQQETYDEFDMAVSGVVAMWVNPEGAVLMNVHYREEEYLIIRCPDGSSYRVTPPTGYRVLYLGRDLLAVQTTPVPFLLVKQFDDTLRVQADLRPLQRLGLEFEFFFNQRGTIDLATLRGAALQVTRCDIANLATDAARWELLARAHEEAQERSRDQAREEAEERASDQERRRQRSLELARELATTPVAPLRRPSRSPEEIRAELERRRLEFAAGNLDRADWLRLRTELEVELQEAISASAGRTASPFPLPTREESPEGIADHRPLRVGGLSSLTLVEVAGRVPGKKETGREKERVKIERLLESLDERLAVGELDEATYRRLRQKYLDRLQALS